MPVSDMIQLAAYAAALILISPLVGRYLQATLAPAHTRFNIVERAIYGVCGVDETREQNWKQYLSALLLVNFGGFLLLLAILLFQDHLPMNPASLPGLSWHLAFNTAISFVTNTNWQSYSGESTMSVFSQMCGLTVQNFLSPATAIAVVLTLIRGFARRESKVLGNFYVDMTRSVLWVLLPIAMVFALVLVWQGVPQNFDASVTATTLEGVQQNIATGPVASQEAIKMLGTNGGGFFNANSAHPYENPTALSNFFQMVSIFLIPAGLCFAFGRMVGDRRQGWALLAAMTLIFVVMTAVVLVAEQQAHPGFQALGVDQAASLTQAGGNMEGKETRFGISAPALFAAVTTAASCGAVNAMHDSFLPLGGMVPMVLIQLGEVVFGGVGTGLYTMLIFAIMAVFIAGLMIGRTPEYLGKKIQAYEMKMTAIAILVTPTLVLAGTAIAVMLDVGKAGMANPGAHGFSEILYAFSSAANNNGSAFAGLSANTPFYNSMLAVAMWFGRFAMIVPILAVAGSLARKQRLESNAGTMPTHGPMFIGLLVAVVVLVGVLNYVPALALGPVIEHLQLFAK
ncbi:potassium-transporting ATPase subunit KdpA [Hydrocarboniphaga sp.]|uniref:potassium-transporting ATPase subunit KdpA n=1 Tax=Hydrocarboniphaga sp. TaxID=2033016 RepID=UPI003454F53F